MSGVPGPFVLLLAIHDYFGWQGAILCLRTLDDVSYGAACDEQLVGGPLRMLVVRLQHTQSANTRPQIVSSGIIMCTLLARP